MTGQNLTARIRERDGKGHNRRLRRSGWVPGVVYGNGIDGSILVAVDKVQLRQLLNSPGGRTRLLRLDSGLPTGPIDALIKEVQWDPVTEELLHVDLQKVETNRKVHAQVPVHLVGEAQGVKAGGIIQFNVRQLEVECLPQDIPAEITIDISHLKIGGMIRVKDIPVPPGCQIAQDPDTIIAAVIAPRMQVEDVEVKVVESVPAKQATTTAAS
ncbi:50S ribosomal protein L25 [Carboxydocella sp. JDF658]|uniref:50S ribosomal protein L25 n=1 Tax=Carboxydocella sp. JDF658 TaxID=1926600 RepID=UPI0009AEA942|nr:50S ribosomal protein L25 [Carboxydocella sp. JDF658]GAW32891.1 hypothetical protein JDF658_26560 [Carboxydocella sp. JDF658]